MAIQYFDAGRAMGNALAGAAAFNEIRERDQMRNFRAQNGEALMSGDPAALGAYAQYDPGSAFTMRRQMDADARAKAAEGRDMAEHQLRMQQAISAMSADERAQAAEEISNGLRGAAFFYSKGDEAGYNQFLTENEIDPEQFPFGQFPAHAAQFEDVLTALTTFDERNAPDDPADEYGRYVEEELAAGREPLSRIDFKRAGQKSMRVRTSPDGSTTVEEVFGGEGVPDLTVDAAKNTGFLIRTRESNAILDEFDRQGTDFWQTLTNDKGGRLGNYALTPEFQKFDQAKRDFVNAILRRESGAVISPEEFANAERQYFPVPGDSEEVIRQKRQNRRTAIEGLRVGSGAGAAYVEGQPTAGVGGEGSQAQPGQAVDLQGADLELFGKYGVPIGQ